MKLRALVLCALMIVAFPATSPAPTGSAWPTLSQLGGAALASPAFTGNPTAPTQASSDNSTALATTAYTTTAVNNAIAAVNPAVAVQAATTAFTDTSSFTYANGVSGVGATLTGPTNNQAVTIDGFTFTAVGQRLLVKNDTQSPSGAFNGVYSMTVLQTVGVKPVFTRASDYNQSSDINNTGAIPVVNGTANASTSWLLTSSVTTVGTDALTYAQFSVSPSNIARTNVGNTFTGASTGTSWTMTTPVIASGLTASGSGSNDFSGSSGTFKTSTGATTLGSTATVTTGYQIGGAATAQTVLASNGTNFVAADVGAWDGIVKVSGSNATTTGQTLVDITGLVTPTLSNSTLYEIEAVLYCTTSADATGTEYGIHGAGTGTAATCTAAAMGAKTNAVGQDLTIVAVDTPTAAFLTTSAQIGTVIIKGWVTTTSTGTATISIQHLKVTSGTSTVKIGSLLKYRKA